MIYMDQKGGEKQRPATGEEEGVNVQRIRVSPGQDTEVSIGGAEVREAVSHSSWEGARLHCRMCRFLKIKTGRETACLFGGWCLPCPHSYSKVFPSSSKPMQSNSGQYPIFETKEEESRGKKQKKTQTSALCCPPAHAMTM